MFTTDITYKKIIKQINKEFEIIGEVATFKYNCEKKNENNYRSIGMISFYCKYYLNIRISPGQVSIYFYMFICGSYPCWVVICQENL